MRMNSLRLLSPVLLVCILVLHSCTNDPAKTSEKRAAKGDRFYGSVFRMNETEYFRSLHPLNITEVVGHRITNQIYEELVQLNQADLSVEPALAERWEVSRDAKKFTFFIRKGVLFHADSCFQGPPREMTAQDVQYCFTRLCKPGPSNQGFWLFDQLVAGASACYNGQADTVSGIKVLNSHTLEITLTRPFASFLYRLAMPFCAVYPREAAEAYGENMRSRAVGTGPFMLHKVLQDEAVVLKRNPSYWKKDEFGNQLPYLDGVKFSFIKEEKVEMMEFRKGNLDMKYRLPLDQIQEIIDEKGNLKKEYQNFQAQKVTELSTQYYGFLHTDPVISNVHVRRAMNYAIDRQAIVNYTVKGEGTPAFYGLVPVGMKDYPNEQVKGFTFDPKKAKEELAKAGYPDGKGFPKITLQINSGGGRNEKVAEAIQSMLRQHLNIEIDITQLPFAQHLENLETGKAAFWRLGWNADYPDPENFLNLCYGPHVPEKPNEKSYLNSYRYKNATYDALFDKANATPDATQRNDLYRQMDQIIIDDAVIMPLYYTVNRRLLQPGVRNFPANGMEYRQLREVWIE